MYGSFFTGVRCPFHGLSICLSFWLPASPHNFCYICIFFFSKEKLYSCILLLVHFHRLLKPQPSRPDQIRQSISGACQRPGSCIASTCSPSPVNYPCLFLLAKVSLCVLLKKTKRSACVFIVVLLLAGAHRSKHDVWRRYVSAFAN